MRRTLNFTGAILLAALLCLGAAGCGDGGLADNNATALSTGSSTAGGGTATTAEAVVVSDDDRDASWDDAAATKIVLGATASVSGAGAVANGGTVTISAAGTYVISGTTTDGQIVVDASKDDEVQLVLNQASITNKTGAAIYAPQCDNLKITLADGTKNTVTDGGAAYIYGSFAEEEPNAAIFSKDSLSINGNGSLTVNAGFNNGIGTKDDLVIVSGTYVINAANHALRGNDSVAILGGELTLTAGQDGIKTSNTEDAAKGIIDIRDGSFAINAAQDGINSSNGILVSGGSFEITAGDDAIHADASLDVSGGTIRVAKCYEGLEGSNVTISGGDIIVKSSDDGINAAGGIDASVAGPFGNDRFSGTGTHSVSISGGNIVLYSTSDGIDSNGSLTVTGGTIAVFIGTTRDGDATDTDGGGTILPALYGSVAIAAGAKLEVGDLYSVVLESNVTKFCLMIPGLAEGQQYQVTANGSAIGTCTATTAIRGMMMGGAQGATGGAAPGGGTVPGGGRARR
jgi:hypothetical protein